MAELDFNQLVKLMENPDTEKTAMSIGDMLKEANKLMDMGEKVIQFMDRLESNTIVSTFIRANAKKNGVELAPIKVQTVGVQPASDVHKQIFEALNGMPADELKKQLEAMQKNGKQEAKP